MSLTKYIYQIAIIFLIYFNLSCQKEWLNAKSDQKLVIPTSIQDFQGILDNTGIMNLGQPGLGEVSADNYYVTYSTFQSLFTQTEPNAYIWSSDVFHGESNNDWNNPYQTVFYSNNVLGGIGAIAPTLSNQVLLDNLKGSALFYRAFSFFNLAGIFAKPYDSATASIDLGIPLRLNTDITQKTQRSSIKETYDQIITDLKQAAGLLPEIPTAKTRPSRSAAYALLSRVYLSIEDYGNALLYSDSCLQISPTLMDFNTDLNVGSLFPVPLFNTEDIFHSETNTYYILLFFNAVVDSSLYNSYSDGDLRKTNFFTGNNNQYNFVGSYSGSLTFYCGLATDEMYLTRAECNARSGNVNAALADLNYLLQRRWSANLFVPITASDANEALNSILIERRKELIFRGLRWIDLRRLNKDSQFAVTLLRNLNGQTYSLSPTSDKYTLPIPPDEIKLSGIQQNTR